MPFLFLQSLFVLAPLSPPHHLRTYPSLYSSLSPSPVTSPATPLQATPPSLPNWLPGLSTPSSQPVRATLRLPHFVSYLSLSFHLPTSILGAVFVYLGYRILNMCVWSIHRAITNT